MRSASWQLDSLAIEFEDRDVTVRFTDGRTLAVVTVEFRMVEKALETSVEELKRRAEHLAGDYILDLALFLDSP